MSNYKKPKLEKQCNKSSIAQYQLTVTTSNAYHGAEGTTNVVYVVLTGENGKKTEEKLLKEDGDLSFRKGETDVFEIETADVGLPVIIKIGLREHAGKNPWAVRSVVVKYERDEILFPVHDWIEDEISVTRGEALLSQKIKNPDVLAMRKQEIEKAKAKVQWSPPATGPDDMARSLPRFMNAMTPKELPLIFHPTESWAASFSENNPEIAVKKAMGHAMSTNLKLDSLESYHELYTTFEDDKEKSSYLHRWQTDEEFGRQQLNEVSPISIERCCKIPDICQITENDVKELLNGRSLQAEIDNGKIYIGDYSKCYQGVTRNKNTQGEQLYCPDAICLYYVNSEDNLVPIAIQLVPNDPETIFTPKSSADDWMLAKMYFRVAYGNMHEWYYHFLLTHGAMEPFSISMFRFLPRSHPIYKLLRPHLQTVAIINTLARTDLLRKESSTNNALGIEGEGLARHMFKTFHFDDLVIPEECLLIFTGLDNKKLLPKFHYRDDALDLWEIVEDFVSDVINHYYRDSEDVQKDEDLQGFIKDVAEEGWAWYDGDERGLPVPITCVSELIRVCTTVMYTSSVQHAAVNFPQYQIYKYIPNGPFAMRLPPHKKGEATMQRILDSLPNMLMSLKSIAVGDSLSTYDEEVVLLGNYPIQLFTERRIVKYMEKFKKRLKKHDEKVQKRNEEAEYPYVHLLTEKIPNSIAI